MSKDMELSLLPERNCYGWLLVKIEPLENLKNYKSHKRLIVFYEKGVTCALCGKRHGAYIGHYKAPKGDIHIDVYTEDGVMINRDHIIPRSKGGANTLANLQPTCEPCNTSKGNGDTDEEKEAKKIKHETFNRKFSVGDLVKFNKKGVRLKRDNTKTIYEVIEIKTKGQVILSGESESSRFHIAQTKIDKYKYTIGDNVYIKKMNGIFRVLSFDEESVTDLNLNVTDLNGNKITVNQKELKLIEMLVN